MKKFSRMFVGHLWLPVLVISTLMLVVSVWSFGKSLNDDVILFSIPLVAMFFSGAFGIRVALVARKLEKESSEKMKDRPE